MKSARSVLNQPVWIDYMSVRWFPCAPRAIIIGQKHNGGDAGPKSLSKMSLLILERAVADAYFQGQTLDDVMRQVFKSILSNGEHITPSKGAAAELRGVLLEITDPRARLSRTETRGKPFSCLGELCWYLAESNDLAFISYYIRDYDQFADGNTIFGAYGPRLFNWNGLDQVRNVTNLLKAKRDSRQAVIQLFDAGDLVEKHNDVPCTCTLQFLLRNEELHMFACMRSNDSYLGMPHDIFSFTMLQEIVARSLSVELGTYKHAVGSLHIYDRDLKDAKQYLEEGWQSTTQPMPPMPDGDPWPAIKSLLEAESALRVVGSMVGTALAGLDPYWEDLIRLLCVLRCWKDGKAERIHSLRDEMYSDVYRPFIERRLNRPRRQRRTQGVQDEDRS